MHNNKLRTKSKRRKR